jgi:uncharacterized membrane protein
LSLGDRRTRLLAVLCLSLLAGGISWRWATVLHGGDYRYSWARVGYSDIVNLYVLRDFAAHAFPYVRQPVEYPVLTGLTMWVTSYAPAGVDGYFLLNATLLAITGLATFFVLSRFVPAIPLARYALAPGLFLYGALNWDMFSLLALSGGLFAAHRRRFGWCGFGIGIGASYKLYPAFVLPVLLALAAGEDRKSCGRQRNLLALAGTFLTTAAICNLPLAIVAPSGWSYFLRFQSGRSLDPDAIWSHLPPQPDPAITRAFVFLVIVGTAWLAIRVYWNRGEGWQHASLACLLLFLVATRDYSPQYDVWPLPLLAILACPWSLWIVFVVADLTYYIAIFLFLYPTFGWPPALSNPDLALGVGVWSREAALLLLLAWAIRAVLHPRNAFPRCRRTSGTLAIAAASLGPLVSFAGAGVALASDGVSWREIVLVLEAVGLAFGAAVGVFSYTRCHSSEVLLFAAACLVPYFGVAVFNFAIGSFLLPGLLLTCIGVAEGWAVGRGGDPRWRVPTEGTRSPRNVST